jgi:hypothetical protein
MNAKIHEWMILHPDAHLYARRSNNNSLAKSGEVIAYRQEPGEVGELTVVKLAFFSRFRDAERALKESGLGVVQKYKAYSVWMKVDGKMVRTA